MFKVNKKKLQNDVSDVAVLFLLLTLNMFHTFTFLVFLILTLSK